ncbi:MAG: glycosyl hydrolase family 38 [Saprospiraceae bacterium]|jgi:alpha-mannosidase|nr:glycosyl hydrolase family 38 [Saprospiraceae bacterium]
MKPIYIIIFTFLFYTIHGQLPADVKNTILVNGFVKKTDGLDFSYNSSIPVAKECMLIRAYDGKSTMEWETAPAPSSVGKDVTFVWLAGIGSSPGIGYFDVVIDGVKSFTFATDGSNDWHQKAANGMSLHFKSDMTDSHGDRFGFMYLKVPSQLLVQGKPLKIRITGQNNNKSSWYMTFKFQLEDGIKVTTQPGIIKSGNKQYQLAIANVLHFGADTKAKIFIESKLMSEPDVKFGYNYLKLQLPVSDKTKNVPYRLEIVGKKYTGQLNISPVRKWNVHFVQHSHTDIGYTRSQTEILAEHLRFIDYALDYCDNTDQYHEAAKFRWTCEASWAVDEYLRSRPASQVKRLKKRISEGRIEVTGMYFNFDELPDEQILAASLQPLKRIKDHGINVKTAMQNDVNGIGWSLCDYYSDMGVKYLNMGTHGHRALICFDKPTLFWWESPSGKRMLTFRAEHYMTGNTVFKIHAQNFNVFETELLNYLRELEAKGYAYDKIAIQHSGYLTDNSAPSTLASDMIRQWNEKYEWPKLKTAISTTFFEEMESAGHQFEVIKGAWPDWWTDGFGASAREVATTRTAQSDFIANTAGMTMAAIQGAKLPSGIGNRIDDTNSALLFYTEHTVGYHASVNDPYHKYSMEQKSLKESYAWEAGRRAKMLGEETMGLLQSFVQREKDPSIIVYNTLNWERSGLIRVYIDHQILPRYTSFYITDQAGNPLKAQPVEHHSDGTYWAIWADRIPAFGYKKFVITTDKNKPLATTKGDEFKDGVIENKFYKIKIDFAEGGISSLIDKDLNAELVDIKSTYKLGEFIYERLSNRSQMESRVLNNFTRKGLDSVWYDGYETGAIWNTIRCKGNTVAANEKGTYVFEIRIFNDVKRIDLFYAIDKKLETAPEGIYIAFPFAMDGGQLAFDVQGGEVRAGIDQIPGSSNDWNTVQNYARLYDKNGQVLLSSSEMPLMQFGAINTGRYKAGAKPERTHIFGWPMNNYWVTNFNAYQFGGHEWMYTISGVKNPSATEAVRFGWGKRTPFLSRVLPGGGTGGSDWSGSFLKGWADNLLLVSAIPGADGKSAILHLRETESKNAVLRLYNGKSEKPINLIQTDVTGEPVKNGNNVFNPLESKFFRVMIKE